MFEQTIKYLSHKWQLSSIRPLAQSSFTHNYVAVAYSAQYKTDIVLKILTADTHEPEALQLFNGNGCVKLLDYDPKCRGLLLEYIKPGTTLKSLFPKKDAQAVEIAAELIKKLHSKDLISQAHGFKTVNQWLDLLNIFQSKKIPEELLKKAKQLSEKLLGLKQKQYLLHGDLHHENILRSINALGEQWIAIDPKGVIGPLEYEFGRFIMNPIPDLLEQQEAQQIIKTRIEKFSEIFGFDKKRLTDWTFVQTILGACWAEQDKNKEQVNYFIKFAETIENLC